MCAETAIPIRTSEVGRIARKVAGTNKVALEMHKEDSVAGCSLTDRALIYGSCRLLSILPKLLIYLFIYFIGYENCSQLSEYKNSDLMQFADSAIVRNVSLNVPFTMISIEMSCSLQATMLAIAFKVCY
jgi:hypothetical protein